MQHLNPPVLVADIGGTHIRIALAERYLDEGKVSIKLHDISVRRCRDYDNPVEAIQDYPEFGEASRQIMCLAVAAPVNEGNAHLTNHEWKFNRQAIQNAFNVRKVRIVNDFYAQAMAVPYFQASDIVQVNVNMAEDAVKNNNAPRLVIGPGTGLGTASLIPPSNDGKWQAIPAEGGHVEFAPRTTDDFHVINFLLAKKQMPRVSVEDILSGRGIERLYQAHFWRENKEEAWLKDKEIIQRAIEKKDPLCEKVLHHFCEVLGSVAGNAALVTGARAGVYITGGLVPRFPEVFMYSRFLEAFVDKGPVTDYMKAIPVYAVFASQPGLVGAAAIAM